MESEIRVDTHSYSVYWVTDNQGIRHLYHDHLAAQMAEDRYAREAREQVLTQTRQE
jgi:hypothetical protein